MTKVERKKRNVDLSAAVEECRARSLVPGLVQKISLKREAMIDPGRDLPDLTRTVCCEIWPGSAVHPGPSRSLAVDPKHSTENHGHRIIGQSCSTRHRSGSAASYIAPRRQAIPPRHHSPATAYRLISPLPPTHTRIHSSPSSLTSASVSSKFKLKSTSRSATDIRGRRCLRALQSIKRKAVLS